MLLPVLLLLFLGRCRPFVAHHPNTHALIHFRSNSAHARAPFDSDEHVNIDRREFLRRVASSGMAILIGGGVMETNSAAAASLKYDLEFDKEFEAVSPSRETNSSSHHLYGSGAGRARSHSGASHSNSHKNKIHTHGSGRSHISHGHSSLSHSSHGHSSHGHNSRSRSRSSHGHSSHSHSGGHGSCFPSGELVQLRSGTFSVPIENVQAGDKILEGGKVMAVMRLLPSSIDHLYRYNEAVWVTGKHTVYEQENGRSLPVHVQDSIRSEKRNNTRVWDPHRDMLYNLVTEDHRIVINGTIFADWEEQEYSFCDYSLLAHLNGREENILDCDEDDDRNDPINEGSFAKGTMIARAGLPPIAIEDVKPGDIISSGRVLAVMELHQEKGGPTYQYGEHGVVVTKWTIVDDSGEWKYVQDVSGNIHAGNLTKDAVFHQLITSTHKVLTADGMLFSDYEVIDEAIAR